MTTTPVFEYDELVTPATWRAGDVALSDVAVELTDEVVRDLLATAARLDAMGVDLASATAEHFADECFDRLADRIRHLIVAGPGFAVVRNFPVAELGDDAASLLYWGIGSRLGTPMPQNRAGDRVYLVTDTGRKVEEDGVRGSVTNSELIFHTDSASAFADSIPDVLGLLCLRKARQGGTSLVVSAHAVHNALRARAPESLQWLYEKYLFDRSADAAPGDISVSEGPIFHPYDGTIGIRYNRYWINEAYRRTETVMEDERLAALDAVDEALADPSAALCFDLEPGDVYFADNHLTLHNRMGFEDDPEKPRCLVRLWLAWPDGIRP